MGWPGHHKHEGDGLCPVVRFLKWSGWGRHEGAMHQEGGGPRTSEHSQNTCVLPHRQTAHSRSTWCVSEDIATRSSVCCSVAWPLPQVTAFPSSYLGLCLGLVCSLHLVACDCRRTIPFCPTVVSLKGTVATLWLSSMTFKMPPFAKKLLRLSWNVT